MQETNKRIHTNPTSKYYFSRPQPNINVPDASGMSPLMRACAMQRKDIVNTLLECGADVNFGNSANRTSAMLSCLGGNLEVLVTS